MKHSKLRKGSIDMTDVNEDDIQIETPRRVGERLKQAREEKKYSVAEVSAQLRLMQDIINALESDRWDQLHGRAYARGYFSSYVKFLGLPEDDFLSAFNREFESSASDSPLSNVARLNEPKSFSWGKLLFICILIVITWFAYQQWLKFEADSASGVSSEQSEEHEALETTSFSESVVEPILSSVEESSGNANSNEAPQTEETAEVTPDVEIAVVEVEQEVIEETSNTDVVLEEAVAVAPSEIYIALIFSQDCWVKITDVDNQVLVNKLKKQGTRLELTGNPPLSVSLGRASGVEVKVNDTVFDISAFTQADVAKFTLGNES